LHESTLTFDNPAVIANLAKEMGSFVASRR
jgi:hypothetical protein